MVFLIHTPTNPLNKFVSSIVFYEGFEPIHTLDRFLPDGNTEILIDLTENPQYIHDNHSLKIIQTCRRAWVSGVRTHPITIPSGKGSKMVIIAFHKGAAHPFYPMPMSELTDLVVDADFIFGRDILDLREQLLASPTHNLMFLLVEKFLWKCSTGRLPLDGTSRCVDFALSSMSRKPDHSGYELLRDQIGYSQKHFINLFKKHVGLPPKQYLKIMRFQKVIVELERISPTPWSDIALGNGYYDQAHFIHEFKSFSGFTPGEYAGRKTELLNYVPVL